MLSWSASETSRALDVRGIIDPEVDTGIEAGRELAAVGRAVTEPVPDAIQMEAVAMAISESGALKAVMVAGAFEILNRIVDATGLPIGRRQQETLGSIVSNLGLARFPHADHAG